MVREYSGEITYWNHGAAELYGYDSSEVLGVISHELLKTVFPIPQKEFENQLLDKGVWIGELIHTASDGRKIIVESRHQLFEVGDGKKLVLETNRDITARETQYRTLFEGMQEGACFCRAIYDGDGQLIDWLYLDVNPALEKILGISGMAGKNNSDLFPRMRESNPKLFETFGRVVRTGMPGEFEGYLEGQDMWLYVSVFSPARGHFIAIGKDITKRKMRENELKTVKLRLEQLLAASPAVIYSCRPEDDFGATFISANLFNQLGYTPDEFMSQSGFWAEHIHPEDAPRVFDGLHKLFETDHHTHEYRFLHKNGTYRWMLDELRLVRDDDGKPVEIIGAWHDISSLKLAEDELRENEQSLRLALDAAEMGMWDWNLTTDALWWDEREYRLFGIPQDEFSGYAATAFGNIHSDDRQRVREEVNAALSSGQAFQSEFRVMHPDGSVHWLAARGQGVENEKGGSRRMMGVNFDITERKKTENERDKYTRLENMAQVHRLHIAGEFAALLAHQLNQPLTAIRSFAEAGIVRLRRGKVDPLQMRETLEDVVAQSDRAAGSIRDLRKFLARQPQEMVQSDLNAEVNAACSLMEVIARGRQVGVGLELGVNLPPVYMRPSQIEQVIVNLMENALQAISDAGKHEGEIKLSTSFDEPHGLAVVKVEDSGPGITSDLVGKVFDPLYTTKKNGIGMGLAISRSIIEDHGGHIWAESGPGGCFVFTLPVKK